MKRALNGFRLIFQYCSCPACICTKGIEGGREICTRLTLNYDKTLVCTSIRHFKTDSFIQQYKYKASPTESLRLLGIFLCGHIDAFLERVAVEIWMIDSTKVLVAIIHHNSVSSWPASELDSLIRSAKSRGCVCVTYLLPCSKQGSSMAAPTSSFCNQERASYHLCQCPDGSLDSLGQWTWRSEEMCRFRLS